MSDHTAFDNLTDQQISCECFNSAVRAIFPDSFVNARVVNLVGSPTIVVNFAIRKEWVNNIIENDPLFFKVLVQDNAIDGPLIPKYKLKLLGVPFRKIKGKTEREALEKFAVWLIDRADTLKKV